MKHIQKISVVTILAIGIFMLIALFGYQQEDEASEVPYGLEYFFNEEWRMEAPGGTDTQEIKLPYTGKCRESDVIVFHNTLPIEYADMTMRFFSANAQVRVLLDDEVIYQQEAEGTGPDEEHFIDFPDVTGDRELGIELMVCDPDVEIVLGEVVFTTHDLIVVGLIGSDLADIVCCLLIGIMSVIMFVLALIRRYTGQPGQGEAIWGLFGLLAGVYCFIGTGTLSTFYNIQEAYVMQEYLLLMLPVFLALYFGRKLQTAYPLRFRLLLYGAVLNAGIQIALQIMGLQHLENMKNFSICAVCAVCLTVIVSMIQTGRKGSRYEIVLTVVSMTVLMTGEIVNVILNTVYVSAYSYMAGQYSMTISGMLMAVMHIFKLSKEYRADAEKKIRIAEEQNRLLAQAKKEADAARHEALAANEAKGMFLARMSHEIRTPINAVLGMDEMILRESGEQNIKEYAMDIYTAGQTLLSLINDILDFSKIESGKMEIVPVEYDISSLIHDLVNMTSQRAADKNLRLEVQVAHDIPSRLYGDDVRIRQILTNILTNAVKYTHEGTVWLRAESRGAGETAVLRFEVEDTGIGIREEDLPKLSAEFERIEEDKNRNIEGTGLGMSITIQLLALLGSQLKVESVYGKGSKFYFELEQKIVDHTPIGDFESKVHQMADNYLYSTSFCAPDADILVVDDNAVNRKVLRNLLKETQVRVTEADGGGTCLRLVQEDHFDLIFLDHMMPGMDGVETLHAIKALPECPCRDTPIVVLTANAVSGAKEQYLSEGFDDFLSKPVVPEKLENMIKKWLPEDLLLAASDRLADAPAQAEADGAETDLEALPFVEGLDWNYAWLHLPDMELLCYTVKEFYAQIDSAADALEQAYECIARPDCLEQYRIRVHAMKSLAATVGIVPLSGVARVLEYAARDGKIDVIMSMTTIFLEEWRSYRQKLQGVFDIGVAAEKEVTDNSVIKALLEMVRISMQEMDIDRADELMGQLRAYGYPEEIGRNMQKLAEAVTNLDPDETDRLVVLLAGQME